VLLAPEQIAGNFVWRQRVTAAFENRRDSLEAVLEKSGGRLRVLFLTPYGSRALLLEQQGQEVTEEYFVEQRLPFPARYILVDIHRAVFRGLEHGPQKDGTHEHPNGVELFADTWRGGRLVERRVFWPKADGSRTIEPAIVARYRPGLVLGEPPENVTIANRRMGYRLEIDTR
jgi:hypothetical protein